jgi:outer membrane protein OmpA-like peptidoglycan-associated protein
MSDMAHALLRAACVVGALVLSSCAIRGTVVLLPEKDGRPTAVAVTQGGEEVLLDKPYAAAKSLPLGPRPYQSSADEVQAQFAAALAAQPARPERFTLYFVEGKDAFTDESRQVVDTIFDVIAKRPVPDVVVVGHTDTKGSDEVNDALGKRRADSVREALIARGIAPENVQAISRGKRELLIPTPDETTEPRNRRVEIIVR